MFIGIVFFWFGFVLLISDRKMDLKLFMIKSKDGGLMWCGIFGKVKFNISVIKFIYLIRNLCEVFVKV